MENKPENHQVEVSSESTNQNKKADSHEQAFMLLYELDWFPITTSPWVASMAFFFNLLFIIHCMDFYAENAGQIYGNSRGLKLISGFISESIASIAFVLNILLSILSLLSLFFSRNEEEGLKYILGWIGSKIFPALRYIIEANLAIAGWFMIRSLPISAFFILAAIINLFVNFFGQNYTLRKDYLCCKSMEFLMLFKSSIIVGYLINFLGYFLIGDSKSTLLVFLIVQFIIPLILLISFFLFGYLTYRHTATQLTLIVIINLYFSIALGNLYDCINSQVTG